MNAVEEGYEATARLTIDLVGACKLARPGLPEFVFPPRHVAFLASLGDVGERIARNDVARELVGILLRESERAGLPDYPTAMMLRLALDEWSIPWKEASLEELGLKVAGVSRGGAQA